MVWVVGLDGITIKWIIIKWIIIKWITTPHVRAFLRDDASSEGKQQESASATYERAPFGFASLREDNRKDAAPHTQEPSSETMGGAEVPERGMDQVALV